MACSRKKQYIQSTQIDTSQIKMLSVACYKDVLYVANNGFLTLTTYSTKTTNIQLLEHRKIKFITCQFSRIKLCVNSNYIIFLNCEKRVLFFCDPDLTVINTVPVDVYIWGLTCTNNATYLLSPYTSGVSSYTPHGLAAQDKLFNDQIIRCIAADIDTNLLYFRYLKENVITVGNEKGEVLSQFLLVEPCHYIFVSCNIVVVCYNEHHIALHNGNGGKQITQVKDQRITDLCSVCLVHDKGILVTTDKDQIHLWRVV